ncbi:hypothetical protein HYPSUDRAFT_207980 [Hypholoma sublateritium FD-334 SS-4]|uniref:Uncharacterized protein n=1 Tax=Hypholoma sublateritium (strain FD-334 SS-4) TaxID=945553 RepID=A0A0D2N8B0_HYPSF|nr:hypothetical protein HYPSUDRAFT_207980 [Hypholoma sublateritium FD-334 SS-4]
MTPLTYSSATLSGISLHSAAESTVSVVVITIARPRKLRFELEDDCSKIKLSRRIAIAVDGDASIRLQSSGEHVAPGLPEKMKAYSASLFNVRF